jgi:hypothetical protein
LSGTQVLAGQRITAALLNANIPGDWVAVTPAASWTNHGGGSVIFQCRKLNSVTLEVIGMMNPGTTVDNTTIGVIPVELPNPASTQPGTGTIFAGVNAGSAFAMVVQSSGSIQIADGIGGATEVGFHFTISLDA